MAARLNLITGALSYSGKYLARKLITRGERVRTLTFHPNRENPFGKQIEVMPYSFDSPDQLARSFDNVEIFYNTYYIRYPYGNVTYGLAYENNKKLIQAAKKAGVRRVVNISITNPSEDSPFPYFRHKYLIDRAIMDSGISYAIVRPTVIFGGEDILINNIAWILRHLPAMAMPGNGDYKIQPVFVEDQAEIMIEAAGRSEDLCWDAVGPELYTFKGLVKMIKSKIPGLNLFIVPTPPELFLLAGKLMNPLLKDIILTRDEVYGLMANLLYSKEPPRGKTRLGDWLEQNKERVGKKYASELKRHYS